MSTFADHISGCLIFTQLTILLCKKQTVFDRENTHYKSSSRTVKYETILYFKGYFVHTISLLEETKWMCYCFTVKCTVKQKYRQLYPSISLCYYSWHRCYKDSISSLLPKAKTNCKNPTVSWKLCSYEETV